MEGWFKQQPEDDGEDLEESEVEDEGTRRGHAVPKHPPRLGRERAKDKVRSCMFALPRFNYLALGTFEIAFAPKEVCRGS